MCSSCGYYTFRDCVSWNRGLSRWHPRCPFLSFLLSFPLDQREHELCSLLRLSLLALLSTRDIYTYMYISLFLFVSLLSSTLVDEILWHLATCPSSGFVARRRGRPHVTSGYSRVKSGTRFGRAHPHSSRASVHAPFIIGTASKRMPKAANFAPFIRYVVLREHKRVCCHVIRKFYLSNYREKLINVFQRRPK